MTATLCGLLVYLACALLVGLFSYRRTVSASDFVLGNRSLNFWLTALAAHASDMSNWLFMAYPAAIFMGGLSSSWIAIGLTLCMLLNWRLIAPKIRALSEKTQSLTLSSFFESSLGGSSAIRLFSSFFSCVFYTVYISAGLVGLGELGVMLLGIPYEIGIAFGIVIVVLYVIIGGFTTLAWLDFFQGLFLMGVVLFVPLYLLPSLGGWSGIAASSHEKGVALSLIPNFRPMTLVKIVTLTLGWGLGYFGQPHIITKFMGIKKASEMKKSERVGLSWMILSLIGATLVGLFGISYFLGDLSDPEMVFVQMVKTSFHPFLSGIILSAVIAAIINVTSAQLLTISSVISQDFFRQLEGKASLLISRLSIVGVALLAFVVAYLRPSSIYALVLYAWSGLGATFGPLLISVLYHKRITKSGAWVGMLSGGICSALWPMFSRHLPLEIEPLFPAFCVSLGLSWITSELTHLAKLKRLEKKVS